MNLLSIREQHLPVGVWNLIIENPYFQNEW